MSSCFSSCLQFCEDKDERVLVTPMSKVVPPPIIPDKVVPPPIIPDKVVQPPITSEPPNYTTHGSKASVSTTPKPTNETQEIDSKTSNTNKNMETTTEIEEIDSETPEPNNNDFPVNISQEVDPTLKRSTIIEFHMKERIKNIESNSEDNNERIEGSILARRSGIRLEPTDLEKETVKYEKSSEIKTLLNNALLENDFLKNILTEATVKLIVDILEPEDVTAESFIINQGQTGDYMYISESGQYQVIKDDEVVNTYVVPTVFGEVAIIYDHKRQASIKALSDGRLWKISRNDYSRVIVKSAKENDLEVLSFLKTVPKIQDAPVSQLREAVGLFKLTTFTSGTAIVQQGEEGNEFFIIRAGAVKVTKDSEELVSLTRGEWFGEQALLNNDKKRQATVSADSPVVECLVLSNVDFLNLFGDLEGFMSERKTKNFTISKGTNGQNRYSKIILTDLLLVATLGVGGFGRVELAHLKKDSRVTFALKYLKRNHIVQNKQVRHVLNEKMIQSKCNSPFIVQLYQTYNDTKYLYLLLEPCLGGDVLSLLQRLKFHCCKEEDAKFLAACVLEALSYLHERKIVFRDLKPENMMLDKDGYIKLTDFGFATKLEHGTRTYTFAGTPEYVAPEIIYQRGHDRAVDCWAFGIFIFELLVGKTPFKTSDPSYMQTYNLIVRGINNVVFPAKIKTNASVLIKKLCVSTPNQRMGYKKQGWQEVREHKWFHGFNWDKLQSREMGSPFYRQLSYLTNDLDTRFFEKQRPDRDIPVKDFTEELNDF